MGSGGKPVPSSSTVRASRQAPKGLAGPERLLRVLVVDDHQLFAQALGFVLDGQGLVVETGPFEAASEVLAAVERHRPDVVLLDEMLGPLGSGSDLIQPLTALGARVVMLAHGDDPVALAECLEAGAVGIASKSAPFPALLHIVERTARTGNGIDPSRRYDLMDKLRRHRAQRQRFEEPFRALTAREREVLAALQEGQAAERIATAAFVSVATVRSQIQSILRKLDVRSQLAAVVLCHEAGIAPDRLRRGFPQC